MSQPISGDMGQRGSRRSSRGIVASIAAYGFIAIALVFFLFPIFWIFGTAFKSSEEFLHVPPVWVPANDPIGQFQAHFAQAVELRALIGLRNSLIIASGATLLALIVGGLAAYSIARFNTGGRNLSFWILSQRMMPPIAVIIPIFLLFGAIGWIDTYQALILLYAAFNLPLAIWMMRAYFLDVPVEIEEAALVDGSSRISALWNITLPLAAPGVAATAVFLFIFSWTEFLFALLLARTNVVTLPVIIAGFYGMQSTFWGEAGVVSIIACVPIFILGLAAHRHFARGLTMGAVRG